MSTPRHENQAQSPSYLIKADGARIAYHKRAGAEPTLVFFGGYASDMTGTKALALDAFAQQRKQAFLRFDYQGHGQSSGEFADGVIGVWLSDALAVIDAETTGPLILIGSSMGGWIMLLAAAARPERIAGLVGIAPAPDFTEDLMWQNYDEEARQTLRRDGALHLPSPYGEEPTMVTMRLIEEGRDHLLLRRPLSIDAPIRLLHGMADPDVPYQLSLRIADHVEAPDIQVRLVKDGDHRLSTPRDLAILTETVSDLLDA